MSEYNSVHTGQEIDNFNQRIVALESTVIDLNNFKVSKSGDTMTGNLTLNGLILEPITENSTADILIKYNNSYKWGMSSTNTDLYFYDFQRSTSPLWINNTGGEPHFRSTWGQMFIYSDEITKGATADRDMWWGTYYCDSTINNLHEGGRLGMIEGYRRADNGDSNMAFVLYAPTTNSSTTRRFYLDNTNGTFSAGCDTKFTGSNTNDYAEYRQTDNDIEPGRCIYEIGDDTLQLTNSRLQRGCSIVSDTWGFVIGDVKKCKTPIAVSGRVLAYCYEGREVARNFIGWPVCSGPNGTVSIMSEEEEKNYPSRIIGTISAIPDYEIWEGEQPVKVNGRIWIKVK